jgi:nucleoside-diphosphate kinase
LIAFMLSGPSIAAVVEGERVIEGVRALMGGTDPTTAAPGTIRGDLARQWDAPIFHTLIHGSDAPLSAHYEIGVWFPDLQGSG